MIVIKIKMQKSSVNMHINVQLSLHMAAHTVTSFKRAWGVQTPPFTAPSSIWKVI